MLASAYGLRQYFPDLGHSFSPYGPPTRQITYISWLNKIKSLKIMKKKIGLHRVLWFQFELPSHSVLTYRFSFDRCLEKSWTKCKGAHRMQCCGVTCLYLYSMKHGPPFETTVSFIPETEIIYSRFSCVIGDSDLIFIKYLAIDWDEISSAWSICLLPQGFSICFIIKNPFMVLQVQGAPRSADPQFDNTQTDSWSTIWFYVRSSIARKLMRVRPG